MPRSRNPPRRLRYETAVSLSIEYRWLRLAPTMEQRPHEEGFVANEMRSRQ